MQPAPFSFLWHDYETFGRDPRRDRPAQFAAIRTDAELREIGAPLVRYCKPAPDYLPDPEACLLTGIVPQVCIARGVAEPGFAADIEAVLAKPGTVGVGYNSIRFDDEVTRHLFWRCLIDPYAREWRDGCGRWDLLDVLRCAYALRPGGIEWPRHDDGRASFKLEHLTAANGIAHADAHDALADVRATIALARLVKRAQPKLWAFCLKLRSKQAVAAEIGSGRPFLHVSGRYAPERGCVAVVWPLAPHPTNKNELIVWDLAEDPRVLDGLDAAALRERIFAPAETRLPVKTIHFNRAPVVVGNLATLTAGQAARWGTDIDAALRHAQHAPAVATAVAGLWRDVYARPAPAEPPDVDDDLYGGFVGDADRRRLERLRGLPPEQIGARAAGFDDARLAELVFRYRARNFPQTLSDAERESWVLHCADRLHRGRGGARTLAAFTESVDALADTADERAEEILAALVDYAESIAPEP